MRAVMRRCAMAMLRETRGARTHATMMPTMAAWGRGGFAASGADEQRIDHTRRQGKCCVAEKSRRPTDVDSWAGCSRGGWASSQMSSHAGKGDTALCRRAYSTHEVGESESRLHALAAAAGWPPPVVVKGQYEHLDVPEGTGRGATLLWLHGLGDDTDQWEEVLTDTMPVGMRVVCVKAPRRNLSRDRDDEDAPAVAAWFDVEQNRDRARERCEGIDASAQTLAAMVQSELQSDADVFLGGFSQGGALALYTGLYSSLSHQHREMCGQLKGLVGLSCFIPRVGELAATGATWSHTPVLLCHGEADNVIPRTEAERTQRVLQELGATEVQLLEYSFLQHGINLLELKDTALFIAQTRGVVQPPPRGGWF